MSLDSNLSLDFLKKDNETLKNNGQDSSAGISSPKVFEEVSITQNNDGTWTKSSTKKNSQVKKDNEARVDESKRYRDEVSALENLAKISDDKLVQIATQINNKKQLIIDKVNEAVAAGCSVGIGTFGAPAIVNGVVIGIGVTVTNDYPYIKKYGGLDDPKEKVPFNSDNTIELTSSKSGKGYFSGFTENGGSSVGIYRTVFNNPSFPAIPPTICAQRTAEILVLASEIDELRSQIDNSLISDTNKVKDRKTTSEVFVWGYDSRKHKVQDHIDANTLVINAIEGQSAY